jgi:two-component system, NtrC family, sensor histidine kinase HydH
MNNKPFNLTRRFALVGLVTIGTLSICAALLLSRFLTDRMLRQEAVLTMEFIQGVIFEGNAARFFDEDRSDAAEVDAAFAYVAKMPDVIRASAHSTGRRVVWSSDRAIVGRRYADNDELESALRGEMVVNAEDSEGHGHGGKAEHASIDRSVGLFVELYLPIRDAAGSIVGAVELYKKPRALQEAIAVGRVAIWIGAVAAGLILYLSLFWLTRRADNLIRAQQARLVENETLAAIGQMGTAVAHGIRNPLASIRSSAELAQEFAAPGTDEPARDIIAEVDRMENWVRDLLSYARPAAVQPNAVSIGDLVASSVEGFMRETARRGIVVESSVPSGLPAVRADPLLLRQVLESLLSNAVEAMDKGGSIAVRVQGDPAGIRLTVADTGPGMPPEQLSKIFKPFFTTKPKGLGVGLPMAKRIIERFDGSIDVKSKPGEGTTVDVRLPAATGSAA